MASGRDDHNSQHPDGSSERNRKAGIWVPHATENPLGLGLELEEVVPRKTVSHELGRPRMELEPVSLAKPK